jgi:hypothetical protein
MTYQQAPDIRQTDRDVCTDLYGDEDPSRDIVFFGILAARDERSAPVQTSLEVTDGRSSTMGPVYGIGRSNSVSPARNDYGGRSSIWGPFFAHGFMAVGSKVTPGV